MKWLSHPCFALGNVLNLIASQPDIDVLGSCLSEAETGKTRRLAVEAAGRKILGDTSAGGVRGGGVAEKLKRMRRERLQRMAAAGSGKFPRSAFA